MPRLTREKVYQKAYYEKNKEELKQAKKDSYQADPGKMREAKRKSYEADPGKMREAKCKSYEADQEKKRKAQRKSYEADPGKMREAKRKSYKADPEKKREAQRKSYEADPGKMREAKRKSYEADPGKMREAKHKSYEENPSRKQNIERDRYCSNPAPKKIADAVHYKENKAQHQSTMQNYYRRCQSHLLLNKQKGYYRSGLSKRAAKLLRHAIVSKKPKTALRSYSLHEPKQHVVQLYVKNMKLKVLKNGSLANDLFSAFEASAMRSFGEKRKSKKLTNAVCNIAVRKVVSKALQKRKESVGHFLASVRKVNALQISIDDFGNCFHTASSETYFYDQSYANDQTCKATISIDEQGMHVVEREIWVREPRNTLIPVDEQGRCVPKPTVC